MSLQFELFLETMIMREHETASDMAGKGFWGHCSRHTMAVKVRGRGI